MSFPSISTLDTLSLNITQYKLSSLRQPLHLEHSIKSRSPKLGNSRRLSDSYKGHIIPNSLCYLNLPICFGVIGSSFHRIFPICWQFRDFSFPSEKKVTSRCLSPRQSSSFVSGEHLTKLSNFIHFKVGVGVELIHTVPRVCIPRQKLCQLFEYERDSKKFSRDGWVSPFGRLEASTGSINQSWPKSSSVFTSSIRAATIGLLLTSVSIKESIRSTVKFGALSRLRSKVDSFFNTIGSAWRYA